MNITWTFNNKTLISNENITITKNGRRMSTLAIESVTGHHVGIYSCIGSNAAGSDVHSSHLLVNGLLVDLENYVHAIYIVFFIQFSPSQTLIIKIQEDWEISEIIIIFASSMYLLV